MTADGLVSDGTEPGPFLGGAETVLTPDLLDGEPVTQYVHVDLHPGEYAWVAEVPDPVDKGLTAAFSVSAKNSAGGGPVCAAR